MSDLDKEPASLAAEVKDTLDPVVTTSVSGRNSLHRWLDTIGREQKITYLFELEMWLKSLDRFFRVKNHPLAEQEMKDIVRRDFSEELKIVRNVSLRMSYLASEIMSEESAGIKRFNTYIESQLKRVHSIDQNLEMLLMQPTPEDSLALLCESLADLRVLIDDLIKLPNVSFQTFTSMGKIINREIKRCRYIELLVAYKFKPQYDRIDNQRLANIVKSVENDLLRQDIAKVFLEFFRLLRYLDFISADLSHDRPLKDTLLIFSLIKSETQLLIEFMETRLLKIADLSTNVYNAIDGCIYALQMDLKKVFGRELVGFVGLTQPPPIYAKVENSHGLLRDCFQQSVVSLVQIFEGSFEGTELFESFHTKLDQSMRLRLDIWRLLSALRKFEANSEQAKIAGAIEAMAQFRDSSLKYLMYKDWDDFEKMMEEAIAARSLEEFLKVVHVFSTFLEALLGQVNMRAVLANHVFDYPEFS
jgi:hypothetical protein